MKLKILIIPILFVLNTTNLYSQIDYSLITKHWLFTQIYSPIPNWDAFDINYNKLYFKTIDSVIVYPRIIIDGIEKRTYEYEYQNGSITIFDGYNTLNYTIDKLTTDSLVLVIGEKSYIFISYIPIDENKILIKGDTIEYITYSVTEPSFKGNLYRYIEKNQILSEKQMPSFNIDLKYSICENGDISDIILDSEDSVLNKKIRHVLKTTKGKWNPGKQNNEKIKASVSHKFLVLNKKLAINNISNPLRRAKKLYEKGHDFYLKNNVDSSFVYYSECSSFCEYISSIQPYMNTYYKLYNYWVNSTMNLAVIYLKKGKEEKACKQLKKLTIHDKEALKLYIEYCTKNE